jgi:hypothetical protein
MISRVFAALALCASSVGYASSGQAIGKAVIVSQLSFLSVEELEFGSILPSATAGTVVVAPNGARTKTGGVTLVGGSLVQPARFAGKGTFNQTVLISLSASSFTLTRVGGTQTMILNNIVIGSTPTAILTTSPRGFFIGNPTGIFNFPVGGTLNVNANQTPGDYRGNMTLILNYQ